MYAGKMQYKDINFFFSLCDEDIVLYPFKEDEAKARSLVDKRVEHGWITSSNRVEVNEDWLFAAPGNSDQKLVMFLRSKHFDRLGFKSTTLTGKVYRYFSFFTHELKVDRILLKSKLLDYLFDTRKATIERTSDEDGSHKAKLKSTFSDNQHFEFKNVTISIRLAFNVIYSNRIGEPPLYATSYLELTFDETQDYGFINQLINYAQQVVQFCSYSKEFAFDEIELQHTDSILENESPKKAQYRKIGIAMESISLSQDIHKRIKKERLIPLGESPKFEEKLFQGLIDKAISIDHIPESYEEANRYTKARSILLASAFDWAFSKLYPSGINHSNESIQATTLIEEALRAVDQKERQPTIVARNVAKKVKFLIGILKNGDSFASKLLHFKKEHLELFESLGEKLYRDNGMVFNAEEVAERIGQLRNTLAHGGQDLGITMLVLLDTVFLERIVLASQLLYLGVDDNNTKYIVMKVHE